MPGMDAADGRQTPHIVRYDRKRKLTCDTLAPAALRRLGEALSAEPWWSDRWARKSFRAIVLQVIRESAPSGLVFIGPGIHIELPPPFGELFEPIELSSADPQLRMLSGEKSTREERQLRWLALIFGAIAFGLLVPGLFWVIVGRAYRVATYIGAMLLFIFLVVSLVQVLVRRGGRWFLVPGGVVVIGRRERRAGAPRLITRCEGSVLLRMVSTGKSSIRMIEIWTAPDQRWQRAISEREALAFLAAWQCPLDSPDPIRLTELCV